MHENDIYWDVFSDYTEEYPQEAVPTTAGEWSSAETFSQETIVEDVFEAPFTGAEYYPTMEMEDTVESYDVPNTGLGYIPMDAAVDAFTEEMVPFQDEAVPYIPMDIKEDEYGNVYDNAAQASKQVRSLEELRKLYEQPVFVFEKENLTPELDAEITHMEDMYAAEFPDSFVTTDRYIAKFLKAMGMEAEQISPRIRSGFMKPLINKGTRMANEGVGGFLFGSAYNLDTVRIQKEEFELLASRRNHIEIDANYNYKEECDKILAALYATGEVSEYQVGLMTNLSLAQDFLEKNKSINIMDLTNPHSTLPTAAIVLGAYNKEMHANKELLKSFVKIGADGILKNNKRVDLSKKSDNWIIDTALKSGVFKTPEKNEIAMIRADAGRIVSQYSSIVADMRVGNGPNGKVALFCGLYLRSLGAEAQRYEGDRRTYLRECNESCVRTHGRPLTQEETAFYVELFRNNMTGFSSIISLFASHFASFLETCKKGNFRQVEVAAINTSAFFNFPEGVTADMENYAKSLIGNKIRFYDGQLEFTDWRVSDRDYYRAKPGVSNAKPTKTAIAYNQEKIADGGNLAKLLENTTYKQNVWKGGLQQAYLVGVDIYKSGIKLWMMDFRSVHQ